MKQFQSLLIIFGFIIMACHHPDKLDKSAHNLPDSTLINQVIEAVIQTDSLKLSYDIQIKIEPISIYSQQKPINDSVPPPPPLPFSIAFEDLFDYFGSESDSIKRQNDSIFFCLQISADRKLKINKQLYSQFNHTNPNYYKFFVPIFSSDKKYACVQYWRHCGKLCGNCCVSILKWNGAGWIRIRKWHCGVS